MKGSEFVKKTQYLDGTAWEDAILAAKEWWIVPALVGISIPGPNDKPATLWVSADYFAIGEPDDFVYVPMRGTTAQKVADCLGWLLPTKKIVELAWHAAEVRRTPITKPEVVGTRRQVSTAAALEHTQQILAQAGAAADEGVVVRGHKKDAGILTNRLRARPSQLSIFGWFTPVYLNIGPPPGVLPDHPIQSLSLFHDWTYGDYSHGASFVGPTMKLDEGEVPTVDVLGSAVNSWVLSDEGAILVLRIPDVHARATAATATASMPAVAGLLSRGSKGITVRQFQGWLKTLGYKLDVDGDFGPGTDGVVRQFQRDRALHVTGIVDAEMTTMLRQLVAIAPVAPSAAPAGPATLANISFVQSKNYTVGRYGTAVGLVVIHDMENPERPGSEDGVAAWFANKLAPASPAPMASAHYCVGQHIVQCVREEDMAYHAPGANTQGIGIEHVGYASQTAEQWADPYSTNMLALSARLVADICHRRGIPAVFVDAEGLLAGERGITTHVEVSKAWHKSNHTDPGKAFPIDDYIGRVQALMS